MYFTIGFFDNQEHNVTNFEINIFFLLSLSPAPGFGAAPEGAFFLQKPEAGPEKFPYNSGQFICIKFV